jgi:hypothetical protein
MSHSLNKRALSVVDSAGDEVRHHRPDQRQFDLLSVQDGNRKLPARPAICLPDEQVRCELTSAPKIVGGETGSSVGQPPCQLGLPRYHHLPSSGLQSRWGALPYPGLNAWPFRRCSILPMNAVSAVPPILSGRLLLSGCSGRFGAGPFRRDDRLELGVKEIIMGEDDIDERLVQPSNTPFEHRHHPRSGVDGLRSPLTESCSMTGWSFFPPPPMLILRGFALSATGIVSWRTPAS